MNQNARRNSEIYTAQFQFCHIAFNGYSGSTGSNLMGSDSLRRVSVSFLSPYRVTASIRTTIRRYSDYSTDWTIPGSSPGGKVAGEWSWPLTSN